tara:strand:+ start:294 stop:500 length:207 start_codon:yes stop_codon:yes gene_type:complete
MTPNTGGPAFPHQSSDAIRAGMTLRDYFAAKAMGALLVDPLWQGNTTGTVAAIAYEMADAMLRAREQK